jgi:hypothetical protein
MLDVFNDCPLMIAFNFFVASMPTLRQRAFPCYINVMLNMLLPFSANS